jgi:hypothetical protein
VTLPAFMIRSADRGAVPSTGIMPSSRAAFRPVLTANRDASSTTAAMGLPRWRVSLIPGRHLAMLQIASNASAMPWPLRSHTSTQTMATRSVLSPQSFGRDVWLYPPRVHPDLISGKANSRAETSALPLALYDPLCDVPRQPVSPPSSLGLYWHCATSTGR